MALDSIQSLTEINPRDGGKDDRCVGMTTSAPSCAEFLEILGESNSWTTKDL